MELQVIRHKTAADYFRDFYYSDQAAVYAYQLQRMFESGAAVEGDYFLVKDGGKSYLQAEIYRNNTRRIWEKMPVLSPKAVSDDKKNYEALKLIFEFLNSEEYYHGSKDRLEIAVSSGNDLSDVMIRNAEEFNYVKFEDCKEFSVSAGSGKIIEHPHTISFKPFTEISPEERFSIIFENDISSQIFPHINPESLYQDCLDEGYFSEELWQMIFFHGKFCGYMMPVFTSGLKDKIRLLNYSIFNSYEKDIIGNAIISSMHAIAKAYNVQKLEFIVKSQDVSLIEELNKMGSVLTGTFIRYAKN